MLLVDDESVAPSAGLAYTLTSHKSARDKHFTDRVSRTIDLKPPGTVPIMYESSCNFSAARPPKPHKLGGKSLIEEAGITTIE
jgi:hypothetical protein